ncbi:MAG: hypothetical protein QOJ99_4399, partial [Bryobacterales bacterium]|nr:hypothetical protein [Bryobacterales bacterium]
MGIVAGDAGQGAADKVALAGHQADRGKT